MMFASKQDNYLEINRREIEFMKEINQSLWIFAREHEVQKAKNEFIRFKNNRKRTIET